MFGDVGVNKALVHPLIAPANQDGALAARPALDARMVGHHVGFAGQGERQVDTHDGTHLATLE